MKQTITLLAPEESARPKVSLQPQLVFIHIARRWVCISVVFYPVRHQKCVGKPESRLCQNVFYFSHSFKLSADRTMFNLRANSLNSAHVMRDDYQHVQPGIMFTSWPISWPINTHDFCSARSKCQLYTFTLKAKAKCRKKVLHWVEKDSEVILMQQSGSSSRIGPKRGC